MTPEEELANDLHEEAMNAYPETGTVAPPEVEAEKVKSYLAEATAIVKFLRRRGLV